jgi:hypothetical protein
MFAASPTAARPDRSDPSRDPAAGSTPVPTRTGRLLLFLYKLIDYGKGLAHLVQQRAGSRVPTALAGQFGTMNIALILARIVRGLRLAAELEARLLAHPLREEAAPDQVRAPSERAPRPDQPNEPHVRRVAPQLPDMPTPEEIAEAVRHRPVGAVIADICRDLGITQAHPFWDEMMLVVTEFGGNFVALVKDVVDRMCWWARDPSAFDQIAWPESQAVAACGTGPP